MRIETTRMLVGALVLLAACHGARESALSGARVPAEGAEYTWLSTSCDDGPLDLAALGFERELRVTERPDGLRLIADTALVPQACRATAQWYAKPVSSATIWRFEPRALVVLPEGASCGANEREAVDASLRFSGDLLELVTERSPWCRGFDARFVYHKTDLRRLDPEQLVMHYFAAWNSADADAIADLFVDGGGLIEPFSKTANGNYMRHEGREAIRRWHATAFASTPWLAMNLTAIEPSSELGRLSARWEYMDARLAEPLHGRNLFVVAEGEIYETELQLIDDPKPSALAPAATSSSVPTQPSGATVHAP